MPILPIKVLKDFLSLAASSSTPAFFVKALAAVTILFEASVAVFDSSSPNSLRLIPDVCVEEDAWDVFAAVP